MLPVGPVSMILLFTFSVFYVTICCDDALSGLANGSVVNMWDGSVCQKFTWNYWQHRVWPTVAGLTDLYIAAIF